MRFNCFSPLLKMKGYRMAFWVFLLEIGVPAGANTTVTPATLSQRSSPSANTSAKKSASKNLNLYGSPQKRTWAVRTAQPPQKDQAVKATPAGQKAQTVSQTQKSQKAAHKGAKMGPSTQTTQKTQINSPVPGQKRQSRKIAMGLTSEMNNHLRRIESFCNGKKSQKEGYRAVRDLYNFLQEQLTEDTHIDLDTKILFSNILTTLQVGSEFGVSPPQQTDGEVIHVTSEEEFRNRYILILNLSEDTNISEIEGWPSQIGRGLKCIEGLSKPN